MPGAVTLMDAGQVATPDNASEHVNVIVTGVVVLMLFEFGAGEIVYEIGGGVLSLVGGMRVVPGFPGASLGGPLQRLVAPSVLRVTAAGPRTTRALPWG